MTNHPNRSKNTPVTTYAVEFTTKNGRLHGTAALFPGADVPTNALTSSGVYNNCVHLRGTFDTEHAAALAVQSYLGFNGSVWAIQNALPNTDDTTIELAFSKPRFPKDSFPPMLVRKLV